eukprot:738338-Pyramimonas_sp.AAC.1
MDNKLFTKEDPAQVHKVLGLYALCHFVYRYVAFFSGQPDMGFSADAAHTPWLLAPHALLQISGLQFHLPPKRIKEGTRQWPEYRWHALVFCSRSLALMLLAHLYQRTSQPQVVCCIRYRTQVGNINSYLVDNSLPTDDLYIFPAYQVVGIPLLPLLIVLATMLGADLVKRHFAARGQSSRTIRDLDMSQSGKYIMSSMQFHATVTTFPAKQPYSTLTGHSVAGKRQTGEIVLQSRLQGFKAFRVNPRSYLLTQGKATL